MAIEDNITFYIDNLKAILNHPHEHQFTSVNDRYGEVAKIDYLLNGNHQEYTNFLPMMVTTLDGLNQDAYTILNRHVRSVAGDVVSRLKMVGFDIELKDVERLFELTQGANILVRLYTYLLIEYISEHVYVLKEDITSPVACSEVTNALVEYYKHIHEVVKYLKVKHDQIGDMWRSKLHHRVTPISLRLQYLPAGDFAVDEKQKTTTVNTVIESQKTLLKLANKYEVLTLADKPTPRVFKKDEK